jgi:hypothetical protein
MARNLILLVTIFAAGMFAVSRAKAEATDIQLSWGDWGIIICEPKLTTSVTRYNQEQEAGPSSVFLYLKLWVTNHSHGGATFIPQNTLKIIVGENEFDAADLDGDGESYVRNIEPTLGEYRKCYFELPRKLVSDSFILRFGGFLAETKDVTISISTPTPTPTPETQYAPASVPVYETRPLTNVVSAITKNRWTADALIVSGTLTNSSAVAVQITGIYSKGFNKDQKMVTEDHSFTIVHNDLAPGEVVNFKVALKDDAKKVKFVQVLPTWTP